MGLLLEIGILLSNCVAFEVWENSILRRYKKFFYIFTLLILFTPFKVSAEQAVVNKESKPTIEVTVEWLKEKLKKHLAYLGDLEDPYLDFYRDQDKHRIPDTDPDFIKRNLALTFSDSKFSISTEDWLDFYHFHYKTLDDLMSHKNKMYIKGEIIVLRSYSIPHLGTMDIKFTGFEKSSIEAHKKGWCVLLYHPSKINCVSINKSKNIHIKKCKNWHESKCNNQFYKENKQLHSLALYFDNESIAKRVVKAFTNLRDLIREKYPIKKEPF